MLKRTLIAAALAVAALPASADIKVGLVTALSGQSARAGEAITRGLTVAIDEINARGGVLGQKLVLVRRDDEATPAKGVIAARELIFKEKVAVLFGGLDTPVSMAIVPIANQEKVPFVGPWAAGTAITKNGANPNFVFRVSAVDEIVDKAMLQYAQKTFNAKSCGMILVNNPWGESNEKGLTAALSAKGLKAAGIEKFEANDVDVVPQLTRLKGAGADCLFMVGNVGPSAQVVKSLDRMGWKPPVVSHWGPAGGRFTELAGPSAKDVHFVQTYSFFGKLSPVGQKVMKALMAKYSDLLAVVQNPDAARLMGINVTVAIAAAYAASTVFAGAAGILIAPLFNAHSDMGTVFGLKAFAVAILGGITSAWGVMLAGLLFGTAEALITALLGSAYTQILTFARVIVVLALRPNGLFGRAEVKKV